MQVQTIDSHQIWQSVDGKHTICEVTLKANHGGVYKLKTYSPDIADVGWSGQIISYVNFRGDRFVRKTGGTRL